MKGSVCLKARIVKLNNGNYMLLTSNGSILPVTPDAANEFCLNWKNSKYYIGGVWDYEDVTIETYDGKTVAYVSDDMLLIFPDPELFRELNSQKDIRFIPIREYADKYNRKFSIVQRYCREGRFKSAKKFESAGWYVPEDAPYPTKTKSKD